MLFLKSHLLEIDPKVCDILELINPTRRLNGNINERNSQELMTVETEWQVSWELLNSSHYLSIFTLPTIKSFFFKVSLYDYKSVWQIYIVLDSLLSPTAITWQCLKSSRVNASAPLTIVFVGSIDIGILTDIWSTDFRHPALV